MRILLAEDSERLQGLVRDTLRNAGYLIDIVGSVRDLLEASALATHDLLIVDLGLPDGDGLNAIRELRARGVAAPILIITAREAVDDRIRGLDSGADDYLTKPFNNGELLARIRALLRRPSQFTGPVLAVGPLQYNETNGEVRVGGKSVDLRPSERRLLQLLIRRAGTIVNRVAIENALSEFGREVTPNAVDVHVSRLRKAISLSAAGRVRIETVRGFGYALRLNEECE
ncbi:MAG: response regulator transcription factor [Proteobacteria bacterium]|nr:response regulator transcription factor [Pseudomonadota bacterium]